MVDIVKALNQKTEPLAKKADNLGVPKPTQPNLATALGATDKSAQMAPTPQAQMASQKQTSEQQKSQRSAKIQAEAPRDIAGAADMNSKAAAIIGSIGDTITAERVQGAVDTSAGPAGGEMSQEQGFDLAQSGTGLAGPDAKNIEFADVGETFNVPVSEVLSPEELSEVTGLFGPEAAGMTIDQLQARVEEEANELTAQVDDNREILNDPNQPPDVRQVARQNMIDLGAAHLIATDAELDAFEQDLSKADAIQIQGQTYSLQDLEDNEKVMAEAYNIATQLLENPDLSAEEFNTSESFFNFIQNHANAIQSVFDKNKKMYEEEILPKVDANKAMIGWTDGMDAETLKAIGLEGFGVYQDNDFNKMPGLKALADSETGQADSALIKDMAGLTPDKIRAFLESGDSQVLEDLRELKTDYDLINTAQNPDQLARYTPFNNSKRIDTVLKDAQRFPDNYSKEQLAYLQLFKENRFNFDGLQKALAEYGLSTQVPEFENNTYSEKVDSNFKSKIQDTGLDFKNIVDNPEFTKNRDNSVNALRKVNGLLDQLKSAPDTPFIRRAIDNLSRTGKELRGYIKRSTLADPSARPGMEQAIQDKFKQPLSERTSQTVLAANDLPKTRKDLVAYKQNLEALLKDWRTSGLAVDNIDRIANIEQSLNIVNRKLK